MATASERNWRMELTTEEVKPVEPPRRSPKIRHIAEEFWGYDSFSGVKRIEIRIPVGTPLLALNEVPNKPRNDREWIATVKLGDAEVDLLVYRQPEIKSGPGPSATRPVATLADDAALLEEYPIGTRLIFCKKLRGDTVVHPGQMAVVIGAENGCLKVRGRSVSTSWEVLTPKGNVRTV